ncbi:diguanylate cyclase (GGDEF)-like protein [Stackebrandtia albiflava]|uniref:Diguanylate cyclase (GGDEF)-like protein n=1 Tax=Stackebrandtia albiflava TaxID=406432 RepID=A0A562V3Q0_9ACTN|nr:GGDEF domain-containing protein [Stackebrandtia albiflava]TWJ12458.1 diguanylate cyclase (GGDEF)-like protein [Stackebrandtia albiflava]
MSTNTVTDRLTDARLLLSSGNPRAAIVAADAIAADSVSSGERAWALLLRLAAVINLERSTEYAATVDQAFAAVRAFGDPTALGGFHALAAFTAHADGSLDRCVTHLVRSTRALAKVERPDMQAAIAWHNLAVVFSYIGFHDHAAHAAAQTREVANAAGLGWQMSAPEVQVRHGLSLDHRGDTDGCVRVLRALLSNANRLAPHEDGLPGVARMDLPWIGYAAARLELLGQTAPVHTRRCLAAGSNDAWSADLRHFGRICQAIAAGDAEQARRRLGQATSTAAVLGAAEAPRLRALSHVAEGDFTAAYQADREAFAIHGRVNDQVRRLFVDGVATRLDHEDLRRRVATYADHSLTDPLTGLPNRRHLQDYVDDLAARGEPAVLAVLGLDGFTRINTMHGHLSGDTVLQRTAGALMRVMRRGDFVARYGGDEFVLVLQGTPLADTPEIGRRITEALHNEDWDSLVPGTDLTASIGWAEVAAGSGPQGVTGAFSIADEAMRKAKQARRATT